MIDVSAAHTAILVSLVEEIEDLREAVAALAAGQREPAADRVAEAVMAQLAPKLTVVRRAARLRSRR